VIGAWWGLIGYRLFNIAALLSCRQRLVSISHIRQQRIRFSNLGDQFSQQWLCSKDSERQNDPQNSNHNAEQ